MGVPYHWAHRRNHQLNWVRLESYLKHDKEDTTKAKQAHNPQNLRNDCSDTIKM